ncbi:serine/threonine-protein kinase [Anaeromyxobacter dehalogenans]|uniref:serine/threonine-protein kinase n=1 Tax=Anaeromyxobacter dehalogenans TaxID=161493 RepID=UPI00031ABDD8|nr:serine/threonine-protein kinase [Anaeromyxobacter dehalogenans]
MLSQLGEGGMGAVYLCEHSVLGRRFAVKVLRAERATDAELRERFRNEALAASRIGQENVVDVLDFGEEADGTLYYVMEALEGRSLGAVLREEGALPVGRALGLLDHVCRALAAAHARGVVHRDVKPENVFVVRGPDGVERAKVLDFGISHVEQPGRADRITRAGAIVGTPEYMAPEQAVGGPVDHRSDVYALGVLAYEMLTGALPIVGESAIATLVAHQTQAPEPPSRRRAGIPPEVDALVLRALAKQPEGRFPSMLDFAAEVTRIRLSTLAGDYARPSSAAPTARYELPGVLPVPAPPASAARPGGAPTVRAGTPAPAAARRHRLAQAAAVVGLAAAVGVAGWWWARARAPRPVAPLAVTPALRVDPPTVQDARPAPPPDVAPPSTAAVPAVAPAAAEAPAGAARPVPAAARRPAAPRPRPAPADPYSDDGGLKPDPFR